MSMIKSKPFKAKITAGGRTRWIASDMTTAFTDVEANAETFSDGLGNFSKYVLDEIQFDLFDGDKSLIQMDIEAIELVFTESG